MMMSQVWHAVHNSQHQENLKEVLGWDTVRERGWEGEGETKEGETGRKRAEAKESSAQEEYCSLLDNHLNLQRCEFISYIYGHMFGFFCVLQMTVEK